MNYRVFQIPFREKQGASTRTQYCPVDEEDITILGIKFSTAKDLREIKECLYNSINNVEKAIIDIEGEIDL